MSNSSKQEILEFLEKNPRGATISEISEELEISRQTASKYLEILKAEDRLEQREVGRAKLNYLPREELAGFAE